MASMMNPLHLLRGLGGRQPDLRCECPIRPREIGEPLRHSKVCPVRKSYDAHVDQLTRAEAERMWAA